MKKRRLLTTLILSAGAILTAAALMAAGSLTVSCLDGAGLNGNCAAGRVKFTGDGWGGSVHITVVRDATGATYDDFDYDAGGGLNFTETLYPAGSYTITLTKDGNSYSQSVTAGY